MDLSQKILMLRKQNNLSQEQLAEKLGVSRQAVSKWESQQAAPDIDKIISISEIFGVTTDYLLKDIKELKKVEETEPAGQFNQREHSFDTYNENMINGSAMISLIFGIISLVSIFSVAPLAGFVAITSLIFGIIALTQIKGSTQRGKGFAIAGIAFSSVTLLIFILPIFMMVLIGHS